MPPRGDGVNSLSAGGQLTGTRRQVGFREEARIDPLLTPAVSARYPARLELTT